MLNRTYVADILKELNLKVVEIIEPAEGEEDLTEGGDYRVIKLFSAKKEFIGYCQFAPAPQNLVDKKGAKIEQGLSNG